MKNSILLLDKLLLFSHHILQPESSPSSLASLYHPSHFDPGHLDHLRHLLPPPLVSQGPPFFCLLRSFAARSLLPLSLSCYLLLEPYQVVYSLYISFLPRWVFLVLPHFHISSEPSGELQIYVPEEGHKVGGMHTVSGPATGPARNTRSKTKTSASPRKKDKLVPKHATRSRRSRASVTSVTDAPPTTRNRSTVSPSRDATQTSPYSLGSQTKLLSPIASTSSTAVV
ncbi:hypothetical protein MPTK1_4g03350 [Marchantia polymorpha subsp. ruderalis]|uniref:Uncharacterized protein n=2 Tax=Marchantia polymorpha TaxID=3197 RepID=A0AAF6B5U1_MARPO|nr:hypothetical protein MARPO_0228s0002 [Marchantia polymorpha]BBN07375.1 hypothetical protein Mp_4g03350 [Marchantia polymorpha subsp. ruderalis]|eukprot:PTQ27065.1 hypothetical protein MARPO_0228s0002 [Marchantia polymorpha]